MDIPQKPIKQKNLDDNNMIFSLDMERKKLTVEGILTTEYMAIGDKDKIERPYIVLRDIEYEQALIYLLPDDDKIVWTNPMKMFKQKLAEILVGYVV